MLSIIIPVLNEEKYLPNLLKDLQRERFLIKEIIVADAGSTDKTVEIAKLFHCKVVPGGLPAVGRNEGAKIAQGDLLLFLDADIRLSERFLFNALSEFQEKDLDVASFPVFPQESSFFLNRFTFNLFYNYPQRYLKSVFPLGAMGILVKREIFKKVNGFDPEIRLSEDHCFVQSAAKVGKFSPVKSAEIYMPPRRFKQDGYFITILKYLLCGLHMVILGPVKTDIFKYKFNHYNK